MRTIGMSDYTVGEDCFDELPGALDEYGAAKVVDAVVNEHWPRRFPVSKRHWRAPTSRFWRHASTVPTVRAPISPRS